MAKKKRFFKRVGDTPIIPVSSKILVIFVSLILMSNFMTNLISLRLNQSQVLYLTNMLTAIQLKDMCENAERQHRLYMFNHDLSRALDNIAKSASKTFINPRSVAFAFDKQGKILFYINASKTGSKATEFRDKATIAKLNMDLELGKQEGSIFFKIFRSEYFGAYKYSEEWNAYFVRAESRRDMARNMTKAVLIITAMIFALTLIFVFLGIFMFKKVFASISKITKSLYDMQQKSKLALIDIKGAPNDDITYLAASFNALSVSVNNLLMTFQKFVAKDVVSKAYSDHTINLEGQQRELTVLFSDIQSFTYRTETLGNEIIDLLNVHYNGVIHNVHSQGGVIGSIIGDAILAIFGTYDNAADKSVQAIDTGWEITYITAELRRKMKIQRAKIEKTRALTEAEENVYQAVLLDIGVGIDGGTVFYGNIGSEEHMTNTVIGDNVNSASRLEGVTRIYHLPVIVSDYVMNEVEDKTSRYKFYEIDTIQVKGKTLGKKIFYPLDTSNDAQVRLIEKFDTYEKALNSYYDGDWKTAKKLFKQADMDVCKVFLERIGTSTTAPKNWSGIWAMETK